MTEVTQHLLMYLPIGVVQDIIHFHTGDPELMVNMYNAFTHAVDDTEFMHFYKAKVQTFLANLAYRDLVLLPQSKYFDPLTDGEIIRVYDAVYNAAAFQCNDHTLNEFLDCTELVEDSADGLPIDVNSINIRYLPRVQLLESALLNKNTALLECIKYNFYQYWMALYLHFKHNHEEYRSAEASASLVKNEGLLELLSENPQVM